MSHSEVPPPPGIWSVPASTSRNLAARDDLLTEIGATLARRGVAPLCGLGGTGKTKLAIEYAYRNAGAYDTVFLIDGQSQATMDASFATLAAEMRLPEHEQLDPARAVGAVRSKLGRRGRWLLLFDGVRDPSEVEPYIPSVSHGGHILTTSQNPIWRGLTTVSVRGIERAESVRFLLQRTGETDAESADALAEELGDLPLALAQAGAYIEETGRPLAEYLALFRQRPAALLERPVSFPVTVATAWESALAAVFSHQAAAELLSLCAFLPMDAIPRRSLGEYDPLALDDAIAMLRLHSLIEVRPHALSVHRLVKIVVRNQLRRDDRRRWMEAARRIVQASGRISPSTEEEREGRTEPESG
ncbi:ATP/GTP-binding protein [Sorangium sp. So ce726]|uniref:ATP/GTP-binding protein n=1 Tax=Sorangium sp. So ce726 TaxID=3133319 RepID=UPI003F632653